MANITTYGGVVHSYSRVQVWQANYTTQAAADTSLLYVKLPLNSLYPNHGYRLMASYVYHGSGAAKTVSIVWGIGDTVTGIYSASVNSAEATNPGFSDQWKLPPDCYLRMLVTPGAADKLTSFTLVTELVPLGA